VTWIPSETNPATPAVTESGSAIKEVDLDLDIIQWWWLYLGEELAKKLDTDTDTDMVVVFWKVPVSGDSRMRAQLRSFSAYHQALSEAHPSLRAYSSHAPLNLHILIHHLQKFTKIPRNGLHTLSSKVVFRRLLKPYTRVKILTEQKLRASSMFHATDFDLD